MRANIGLGLGGDVKAGIMRSRKECEKDSVSHQQAHYEKETSQARWPRKGHEAGTHSGNLLSRTNVEPSFF